MRENYCVYCMEKLGPEGAACANCRHTQDYVPAPNHIRPGTLLQNRYLIGRTLGSGGFGITYIGRDTMLDIRVAVKEFYPSGYSSRVNTISNQVTLTQADGMDYEKEMQRFLDEARMLAKFSDEPGIVGVRDFFRENGTAYIVMEYLDGITLGEYLKHKGMLSPRLVFSMLDPIMVSLGRLHDRNLVHRDISPDNIIVLRSGKLKLLDFGAARSVDGDKSLSVVLKHGYAPMEQYQSRGDQGPWTDVYALCATMYKCLTGVRPLESLERVYQDDLKRPSELGVPLTTEQEAALMKGLAVRGKDRFRSMEELRTALRGNTQIHNVHIRTLEDDDRTVAMGTRAPEGDDKTVYSPAHPGETSSRRPKSVRQDSTPAPEKQSVSSAPRSVDPTPQEPPKRKQPPRKGRGRKKLIPLLLLAASAIGIGLFALSGRLLGPKDPGKVLGGAGTSLDQGYTLESRGNIVDPDRSIQIDPNQDTLLQEVEYGYNLLTPMGESITPVLLASTSHARYLGEGLYTIREMGAGMNATGLVDEDGETLIPCQACLIQWVERPANDEGTRQFLLVAYAGEPTDDPEKIFLKYSDERFSLGSNLYGDEIGYEGYAKIYDIHAKAFVDGIEITQGGSMAVRVSGSRLTVRDPEGITVYSAAGQALFHLSDNASIGPGIFLDYGNGTYRVLDENGAELFVTNNYVSLLSGTSGYLVRTEGDNSTILDKNGAVVLELEGLRVSSEHSGIFIIRESQGNRYGLIRHDGTVLLEPKYYTNLAYIEKGLFYGYCADDSRENDKYALVGDQGVIATGVGYPVRLNMFRDSKAFVLKQGDYVLPLEEKYPVELAHGLITTRQGTDRLYALYDLITGEQLLPAQYEYITSAGEYIYAYKSGAWEVYWFHM